MKPSLSDRSTSLVLLPLALGLAPAASANETVALDWRADVGFETAHGLVFGGYMALDSQGNVYACSTPNWAYQLAKVDAAGQLQWTRNIPGVHDPQAFHVAVDSQDNAIVTGYDEGAFSFKTVKFDPDGDVLWNVDALYGLVDEAFRVAVDAQDNVYVTGRSFDTTTSNWHWQFQTIKYSQAGTELWVRHADIGQPRAIAVTPAGTVAVAGSVGNDWSIVCYDTDGAELWSDIFDATLGAQDCAITEAGEVYMCGKGGVDFSGLVVKYDATGAVAWTAEHTGPHGGWDLFRRMTIDPQGNVVAVGQAFGAGAYLDWSVAKFGSDGAKLWATTHNGTDAYDEWATDVVGGPDGSAYVVGFQMAPCPADGGPDALQTAAVKYDSAGDVAWQQVLGCSSGSSGSLALDRYGNVAFTSGREVARLRQRGGAIGTPYCVGAPNSAGAGASISAIGSTTVSDGELALAAQGLPSGQFGLFYFGTGQAEVPFGDGFRCVGGTTWRLNPATTADGTGELKRVVDLAQPPASGVIVPGSTLRFQCWYRDPAAGGASFNLSDALGIAFQ